MVVVGVSVWRRAVTRDRLVTDQAPRSPLYAQGIRSGAQIWVSGMVGVDPATGELAGDDIGRQTRQALANCEAVLAEGGGRLADVVEVGVLLTDPDDFTGMNEAYSGVFADSPPARYVARLGVVLPGVLVSIRMTAVVSSEDPA